jgi:hypothetical protein
MGKSDKPAAQSIVGQELLALADFIYDTIGE